MEAIEIHVNGKKFAVRVDPETPLLYVLRNDLGLKGTRFGCAEGQCMSCTVIIAGRPQTACTVPIGSLDGQAVETVESLLGEDANHPLFDCVLEEQAGQCGYCLAGILMRAKALLDRQPAPTRTDITSALDGHLCRCGAHARIIRAVERAAQAGSART